MTISSDAVFPYASNNRNYNEMLAKAQELFPYEKPNNQQQQIINKILSVKSPGALMVHAATGSGKTAAALSSLLARVGEKQKIVVITRTISQMEPILREWSRIVGGYQGLRDDNSIHILPMLGKAKLCQQLQVINSSSKGGQIDNQAVHQLCKTLPCRLDPDHPEYNFKNQKNEFNLLKLLNFKLASTALGGAPSIEKTHELYDQLPTCAYFDQRRMLKHAKIVVGTYPYIRQPLLDNLMKNMNVKIRDVYFLIDEAHNLVSTRKSELTRDEVHLLIDLFGENKILKSFMHHMRSKRKIDATKIGSDEEWEFLRMMLSESTPELRKKLYITFHDMCRPEVLKMSGMVQSRGTGFFLTSPNKVELLEPTPDLALAFLNSAALTVYQSGTFTPLHHYRKLFGIYYAELLETKPDITSNRFKCFLRIRGLTSIYNRRGELLYKAMAETIVELSRLSPRHTMVISPSYEFKENVTEKMKEIIDPNAIIEETRQSAAKALSGSIRYSRAPLLLMGVAGGKISEGIEIVDRGKSLISMVIFAGLPFVPPSDDKVVVQRTMQRAARDKRAARQFMQIIPLSRKVRQAYGRTIRADTDRGALVILDFRAEQYLMKELKLLRLTSMDRVTELLKGFFKGYKALEDIR
ncbi:MAG: helicase C-terminal domain-containing protein [Candidatus Kariarchaeaceae archaeon]